MGTQKNMRLGQKAPASGLYEIEGPRGGDTGKQRTVKLDKPLPPTPKPGQTYKLVDPACNGDGTGRTRKR